MPDCRGPQSKPQCFRRGTFTASIGFSHGCANRSRSSASCTPTESRPSSVSGSPPAIERRVQHRRLDLRRPRPGSARVPAAAPSATAAAAPRGGGSNGSLCPGRRTGPRRRPSARPVAPRRRAHRPVPSWAAAPRSRSGVRLQRPRPEIGVTIAVAGPGRARPIEVTSMSRPGANGRQTCAPLGWSGSSPRCRRGMTRIVARTRSRCRTVPSSMWIVSKRSRPSASGSARPPVWSATAAARSRRGRSWSTARPFRRARR